jgi:hypothetical protein
MSKAKFRIYPTKLPARNVTFYAMHPPKANLKAVQAIAARLHAAATRQSSGRNLADATQKRTPL